MCLVFLVKNGHKCSSMTLFCLAAKDLRAYLPVERGVSGCVISQCFAFLSDNILNRHLLRGGSHFKVVLPGVFRPFFTLPVSVVICGSEIYF